VGGLANVSADDVPRDKLIQLRDTWGDFYKITWTYTALASWFTAERWDNGAKVHRESAKDLHREMLEDHTAKPVERLTLITRLES
jgi:hypothetical protein